MPDQPLARKPKSWRDILPIQPAATLFPPMPPDELRALGEDIKKNGLHVPVALWQGEDGKLYVIDGVNRLDAMQMVGIPFDEMKGFQTMKPETDPYDFAISMNIERRHLDAKQKRDLIADIIKAKPGSSNLHIAKQVKVDDKTVASVRREMEARSEIPNVATRTDSKGRKQPAKKKRLHRGEVLRGGRSRSGSPQADLIAEMQEIDPEHGRAKALAIIAGVPHKTAIDATRQNVGALIGTALAKPGDDIGPNSAAEAERLRVRNQELENAKRQLETKIAALEREITELKTKREPASAARCEICREKKQAMPRRVFVCDRCIEIHELETAADCASPPADDGLDIPASLDRTKRRGAAAS
jgi:ParB-like nuclease domain